MNKELYHFIGLAYRARKVVTGESSMMKELRAGRVKLLLLADDASELTKKKWLDKSNAYDVTCIEAGNREALAQAIGKQDRVAIAITDDGFAKKMRSMLS